MADFKDKISNLIESQVPDFVLEDHPLFLDFVKAYYQLMESAEIKLTNIGDPDVIKLEGSAGGSIQLDGTNVSDDDDGDNILLEDNGKIEMEDSVFRKGVLYFDQPFDYKAQPHENNNGFGYFKHRVDQRVSV